MKENKNDSTAALSRFGRDKRVRTVTATAERVDRRPRSQRDAADAEHTPYERKLGKRASYNPHFTADNRPVEPRRAYGDKPAYGDRKPRTFGDRPSGAERKPHAYGDKPAYGDRKPRTFGDRPAGAERKPHAYGDKPAYGERKPRTFGDRPVGAERKPRAYGKNTAGPRKEEKPRSYPKYNPAAQTGAIRLNRFIAQSGICSRREADDFITAGLVSVNGKIVTELGTKVMPADEVKFNDSRVQGEQKVYLVLNKPKGYVTSLEDPHADKTVMELVKGACTERIYPAGRLDKNSLGLLLFTNDGDLTKQLTHPSYQKMKIYQVTLDKPLTRSDMDKIAEGIVLEDGEIHADEISYVKENKQEVGIEIHSGRNRIVRRIFEYLGYTVTKLDRVYYAGLTKKNLKRGQWRFLTREEVDRLKSGRYE